MRSVRLRPLLAAALALCVAGWRAQAAPQEARKLLSQAQSARFKGNVVEERRLLASVLGADPEPDQLARAELRLASLAWRLDQDYQSATQHLGRAEATKLRLREALLARARMETRHGRFLEAQAAADRALAAAESRTDRREATVAFASSVAEQILRSTLDRPAGAERIAEAVVRKALARIRQLPPEEDGSFRTCRLALLLALYLGDGPAALEVWSGFFWVPVSGGANGFLAGPARDLSSILPAWTGENGSGEDAERISAALADSRLFPEAAVVALRLRPAGDEALPRRIREIVEYARFCRRLVEVTEEFYRRTALGVADISLYGALEEGARPLWATLTWPNGARQLDVDALADEISIRFGAETRSAPSWGFALAHRLHEESREVVQYGQKVSVRFVLADVLTSTGYLPWLLDFPNAIGGWMYNGKIIQIRSDRAAQAWKELMDPEESARFESSLAGATAENEARARTQPTAFFNSPRDRLSRRAAEGILSSLRAKAVPEKDLRVRFLAEFRRLVDDCTFAHEARHAIDAGAYRYEEKEFRARLSEVAFAPAPGLCLASSFYPDTGEEHARASQRIMQGLLEWMKANRAGIRGLDLDKPLLPQFHLLSDEQIRSAYASLDPLAAEARKK